MNTPADDSSLLVRHQADASDDHGACCTRAHRERDVAVSRFPSGPELRPRRKRRLGICVTAFAFATAAFWATMLTDTPRSKAAPVFSIKELILKAPFNLPARIGVNTI